MVKILSKTDMEWFIYRNRIAPYQAIDYTKCYQGFKKEIISRMPRFIERIEIIGPMWILPDIVDIYENYLMKNEVEKNDKLVNNFKRVLCRGFFGDFDVKVGEVPSLEEIMTEEDRRRYKIGGICHAPGYKQLWISRKDRGTIAMMKRINEKRNENRWSD